MVGVTKLNSNLNSDIKVWINNQCGSGHVDKAEARIYLPNSSYTALHLTATYTPSCVTYTYITIYDDEDNIITARYQCGESEITIELPEDTASVLVELNGSAGSSATRSRYATLKAG